MVGHDAKDCRNKQRNMKPKLADHEEEVLLARAEKLVEMT
jgi:hypothetical protein